MFIFEGATTGLLGVWNDNTTDDLTTPEGDVIPLSANLSDIHYNFGVKCKYLNIAHSQIEHYMTLKYGVL